MDLTTRLQSGVVRAVARPRSASTPRDSLSRVDSLMRVGPGDRAVAIRAYNRYLDLRPHPEPEVEPRVDEVKTELARLMGEGGAQ